MSLDFTLYAKKSDPGIIHFDRDIFKDCFIYERATNTKLSVKNFYMGEKLDQVLGIKGDSPIRPIDGYDWDIATVVGATFHDRNKKRINNDPASAFSEANYRVSYFRCGPYDFQKVREIFKEESSEFRNVHALTGMYRNNTKNILNVESYLEEEALLCGSILVCEEAGQEAHILINEKEKLSFETPRPRFYQWS